MKISQDINVYLVLSRDTWSLEKPGAMPHNLLHESERQCGFLPSAVLVGTAAGCRSLHRWL